MAISANPGEAAVSTIISGHSAADERVSAAETNPESQSARRKDITAIQAYLDKSIPRVSPFNWWAEELNPARDLDDPTVLDTAVKFAVRRGQPYQFGLHPDLEYQLYETYGPLDHPDKLDLECIDYNGTPVQPMPRKWTPEATVDEVLHGAAKDLALLGSVLAARTVNATGFQSDADSVKRFVELSTGLRNITYLLKETRSRRGRPPVSRIANQKKRRRKEKATEDDLTENTA